MIDYDKLNKAVYLLGITYGSLTALMESCADKMEIDDGISSLLATLGKGIDELVYQIAAPEKIEFEGPINGFPKIQEAPFVGKISRETIQRAVDSVSKKKSCAQSIKDHHELVDDPDEYCQVSGAKLDKKKCVKCGLRTDSIAKVGAQITCEHDWAKLDKKCRHDFSGYVCDGSFPKCRWCGVEKCEHESDGEAYSGKGGFWCKCKKCAEFYR